ncbi:Lrp/AsnC family transcriptional regulator [Salininema proteolyticum]|uniref:Lrp/AsnC family transcriptional regulator n=1 Tax=Salininema proteolyticum TaxID=1607685 RepID=A0ABV8TUS0_9ACTN
MDDKDRAIIAGLQENAGQSYAGLAESVGLSAGAVHERVRKLREKGVIGLPTVEVDPVALDKSVLSFITVDTDQWMGDSADAFAEIPEVLEAHVVAGAATLLLKVRTEGMRELQEVLRRLYEIPGVRGTSATIVLESFFARPVSP